MGQDYVHVSLLMVLKFFALLHPANSGGEDTLKKSSQGENIYWTSLFRGRRYIEGVCSGGRRYIEGVCSGGEDALDKSIQGEKIH